MQALHGRAELHRLAWDAVGDQIHVGGAVAKTRDQRFVTIPGNLTRWLGLCERTPGGLIVPPNFRKRFQAVRDEIGLLGAAWPDNALRHSFASYRLALYRDAGRTAFELGHRSPDMLYRHYRSLVTHEAAVAWFGLRP